MWVQSLGQEDPLEEEMATYWPNGNTILVFLPGKSQGQRSLAGCMNEAASRLQSMCRKRVIHDSATK